MKYESEYTAWLYMNYPIYNGDALVHYLEDTTVYDIFLNEMGLTDE